MAEAGDPGRREATQLIHAGMGEVPAARARTVGPPIQRGSTLLLPNAASLYDYSRPTYGRNGLAVHEALAEALCALEHAEHVELYGSGLAALSGAMLAVLKAGDRVLVADGVYGPTRRFCDHVLRRFGVEVGYFPVRATAAEVIARAGPGTRLILMESPASLTFEMQDVAAVAAAARARGVLTMLDNTYAAGLLFRPLDHGVDLSLQALTKYVGGHADVFMGSAAVRDPALAARLKAMTMEAGWAVAPDDAYAVLRGLRTLDVRLARHGENGLAVARWLQRRPEVARVLHPALPGDPDHALYARDYAGACGLFGVVLRPASIAQVQASLNRLELFGLGFSWGGFESLAIVCDPQVKRTAEPWRGEGSLLRLHVGLEDPADLIADLERAFEALAAA